MSSINEQAKNEIRELLTELVVSPISEEFKKVSEPLDGLSSKFEDNSKSVTNLNGMITSIPRQITQKIDEKIDEKVEDITLSMGELSGKLEEIISNTDKIQTSIEAINVEKLKSDLLEATEQLGDHITSTSGQIQQKSQEIEDKVEAITLSMGNLSGKFGEMPNQIIESCKSKHDEIISNTDKIQKSIEAINVEELKSDLLEATEQLGDHITSTSGQIQQKSQEIEDKIKIIIILSVINLLGLIGVMIMYFIR